MREGQTFVIWRLINQGCCQLCSVTNTTKKRWEIKMKKKKEIKIFGKMLDIKFPDMKNHYS